MLRCGSRLGVKRIAASDANQVAFGNNRGYIPKTQKTYLQHCKDTYNDLHGNGIDGVSGTGFQSKVAYLVRNNSPRVDCAHAASDHLPRSASVSQPARRDSHMPRNSQRSKLALCCSHLERTRKW
jgi:hypothetical protein